MEKDNRREFKIGQLKTLVILVAAIVAIGIGIFYFQEHYTVLMKSTTVCLECIGLG